jgi:hypothetical protein
MTHTDINSMVDQRLQLTSQKATQMIPKQKMMETIKCNKEVAEKLSIMIDSL